QNENARAVPGAVFGNVVEVEHAEVAHALFEVRDFGVYVGLPLFCGLVLGVFGKVAVGAGDSNLLGKLDVQLVREHVNFLLQLLFDPADLVRHGFSCWLAKFAVSFDKFCSLFPRRCSRTKKGLRSLGSNGWSPDPAQGIIIVAGRAARQGWTEKGTEAV